MVQKATKTIPDDEFDAAMERIIREDMPLLKRLAKV